EWAWLFAAPDAVLPLCLTPPPATAGGSATSPDGPILPVPYRLTAPPATAGGSATSPDQPCPLSSALLWDIFPPPDGCSRIGATYTVSRPFLQDRKSTRLNSSHRTISYAVFCLKKKKKKNQ